MLGYLATTGLSTLFLGGYYVGDIAAAATGQGGAFVAAPDTPVALAYNPGALTHGSGLRLELGGGLIHSPLRYHREGEYPSVSNDEPIQPAGLLIAVFGVDDLAVALGVYTPSSNHYAFAETGPQRFQSVTGSNYLVHLHAAVAYRFRDTVSVGAAFGGSFFSATQRTLLSAALDGIDPEEPGYTVPVDISVVDPLTFTCNFGISVTPIPELSFGVSFMPPFDVTGRGHASITLPGLLGALATVQGDEIRADIDFPAVLRAGIRYRPTPRVAVEAAMVYEGWSRLQAIRVTPEITVDAPVLGVEDLALPALDLVKNYRDVVSLRLGAELRPHQRWTVRAGGWFETAGSSPATFDISTPESAKVGLAAGASWKVAALTFDASYTHVFASSVTVTDSAVEVTNVLEPENTRVVGNGEYTYSYDVVHVGVRAQF